MITTGTTPRAVVLAIALTAPTLAECNSAPESAHNRATDTIRMDGPKPPEIDCATVRSNDGHTRVRYEIRNAGAETIYMQNGRRMPYQFARDANTLVIIQGVNRGEPGTIYEMFERPLTRPLAPGTTFAGEVVLGANVLHDHYGGRAAPQSLQHGTFQVVCEVGWGLTPITEAVQRTMSGSELFAWQQVSTSKPLTVVLP